MDPEQPRWQPPESIGPLRGSLSSEETTMTDVMITDGMKQQVITRLATINSAISILNLTKGKPANVGVEEVLNLAERIESWAWRDLLGERVDTRAPEKPADPAPPTPPAKTEPQPPPAKDDRPRPNGDG